MKPTATAAFFAASLLIAPGHAVNLPVEIIEAIDPARIVVFLSEEQIASIPEWEPGKGEPPMSIAKVVTEVTTYMQGDARLAGGTIHRLEFKPLRNYKLANRWYCLVQIMMPDDKRLYLAVLPSGQVVPAVVEPKP